MGDHAKHGSLSEGGYGAGDESTGRDVAGNGEEDYMVAGLLARAMEAEITASLGKQLAFRKFQSEDLKE